jgi:hypothetical protein
MRAGRARYVHCTSRHAPFTCGSAQSHQHVLGKFLDKIPSIHGTLSKTNKGA